MYKNKSGWHKSSHNRCNGNSSGTPDSPAIVHRTSEDDFGRIELDSESSMSFVSLMLPQYSKYSGTHSNRICPNVAGVAST